MKKIKLLREIILGIFLLIVLIFAGRMAYNYYNYGDIRGVKFTKNQSTNVLKNHHTKFSNTKTPCQKYLEWLEDRLSFHLLFNTWTPDWEEISQELKDFRPQEVKKGLERILNNVRNNPFIELKENKERTLKELEKNISELN